MAEYQRGYHPLYRASSLGHSGYLAFLLGFFLSLFPRRVCTENLQITLPPKTKMADISATQGQYQPAYLNRSANV